MHGYKYPPGQTGRQHRDAELQPTSIFQDKNFRENQRIKMLWSRCVVPFLAFYLSLEISAAVLPCGFRNKRAAGQVDQELLTRLPDRSNQGDLSMGDAGDMGKDVDGRPSLSESSLTPAEHQSLQRQQQNQNQNQNQYQYKHKSNEKRRKVSPLDFTFFLRSSFRN